MCDENNDSARPVQVHTHRWVLIRRTQLHTPAACTSIKSSTATFVTTPTAKRWYQFYSLLPIVTKTSLIKSLAFFYMRKFLELLRASPVVGAQYVTLQKHFSHPSFVKYFFFQPTHKTKTVTANRWETTNSKAIGRIIIMIGQSETWSSSPITFITLFSGSC
jgi:hypothetical protein